MTIDMFEHDLTDGESYVVCPQCGDDRCYSGLAYDKCDKCEYISIHGSVACPCCEAMSLSEIDNYEICPICNWEDDSLQRNEPDRDGGANWLSLNRSRENYRKYGKIETEQDVKECREYYAKHHMPDGRWLYDEDFIPLTTIGQNPIEARKWLRKNNTDNGLADALAQVYNETASLYHNLIGLEEPELSKAKTIYEEWLTLFNEVTDKIISSMKDDNTAVQSTLLYYSVKPFMEEYGYCNGGGWWIKK